MKSQKYSLRFLLAFLMFVNIFIMETEILTSSLYWQIFEVMVLALSISGTMKQFNHLDLNLQRLLMVRLLIFSFTV